MYRTRRLRDHINSSGVIVIPNDGTETDYLIVGGDSLIGQTLAKQLGIRGYKVAATSRRSMVTSTKYTIDLATLDGVDRLPDCKVMIIVAAETGFAKCEAEPDRTSQINVSAPIKLARRAMAGGARVLFLSSLAVHSQSAMNPSEDDSLIPDTSYGAQKKQAEEGLQALPGQLSIFRPSKIISAEYPLFVQWRKAIIEGHPFEAFTDLVAAPVWIDSFVDAALAIATNEMSQGIYQLSASQDVSFANLAKALVTKLHGNDDLVRPIRISDRKDLHILYAPSSACASCTRLYRQFGILPPSPYAALDSFLESESNEPGSRFRR